MPTTPEVSLDRRHPVHQRAGETGTRAHGHGDLPEAHRLGQGNLAVFLQRWMGQCSSEPRRSLLRSTTSTCWTKRTKRGAESKTVLWLTRTGKLRRGTPALRPSSALYLLADEDVLRGAERGVSVIDWKSSACARVCRSTFASETMACMTAVESADYLQCLFETLLLRKLCRHHRGRLCFRFLSDCWSRYDKECLTSPPTEGWR